MEFTKMIMKKKIDTKFDKIFYNQKFSGKA